MATQITVKEAHHQLDLSAQRFERAMQRTAANGRDGATLSKEEFDAELANKGGIAVPYRSLDKVVYEAAVKTKEGQVGRDDIAEVIRSMKGSVTRKAENNLLAEREATTKGLRAVMHAQRYTESQIAKHSGGAVQQG